MLSIGSAIYLKAGAAWRHVQALPVWLWPRRTAYCLHEPRYLQYGSVFVLFIIHEPNIRCTASALQLALGWVRHYADDARLWDTQIWCPKPHLHDTTCCQTGLYKRFNNRLYRVNGVLMLKMSTRGHFNCGTSCRNIIFRLFYRMTNNWNSILRRPFVSVTMSWLTTRHWYVAKIHAGVVSRTKLVSGRKSRIENHALKPVLSSFSNQNLLLCELFFSASLQCLQIIFCRHCSAYKR